MISFFILGTGCASQKAATGEIRRTRLGGQMPRLPDAVVVREGERAESLTASYRVCLDLGSGRVTAVTPVSGVTGADEAIIEALRTWTWLVEMPTPLSQVCFVENLRFPLRSREEASRAESTEPIEFRLKDGVPGDQGQGLGRSISFRKQRIAGSMPQKPQGAPAAVVKYKVCADGQTGEVTRIVALDSGAGPSASVSSAAIAAAVEESVRTWRYQVAWPNILSEICFVERIELKAK